MKKIFKRAFWGIVIIILIVLISFFAYMLKAQSELKRMTPVESGQIDATVISIRDTFVNMYLVKSGDQFVAVDAGNNTENIRTEMSKLNISPDSVKAVFLTHSDADHVAAIKLFRKAVIYLSRPEIQLVNGEKSRFLVFGNKIGTKEYTGIQDQQTILIGTIKIKGILTPGHTLGSMCYLINDRYLFTGDALSLKDGKIGNFNAFFNMHSKVANESIKIITNLPTAEYILTAHYGVTNDYQKAIKDWK